MRLPHHRRLLTYTNLPCSMSVSIIHAARTDIENLEHLNGQAHGKQKRKIIIHIEDIRRGIQQAMKRLPTHLSYSVLEANCLQHTHNAQQDLMRVVADNMKNQRIEKSLQRQIMDTFRQALRGDYMYPAFKVNTLFVYGLLLGLSSAELMKCAANKKLRTALEPFLTRVSYESLMIDLEHVKMRDRTRIVEEDKKRGGPLCLRMDNSHVAQPSIRRSKRLLAQVDGSDTDNMSFISSSLQEAEMELSRPLEAFVNLLDWRLNAAEVSAARRVRIVKGVQTMLGGGVWTNGSCAERTLISGLLSGQTYQAMLSQCLTVEDNIELADLLDRIELDGLRVGQEWVYTAPGKLALVSGVKLADIFEQFTVAHAEVVCQSDGPHSQQVFDRVNDTDGQDEPSYTKLWEKTPQCSSPGRYPAVSVSSMSAREYEDGMCMNRLHGSRHDIIEDARDRSPTPDTTEYHSQRCVIL